MFTEYENCNQLIYNKMATEVLSIRVLADVKARYQEAFEISGCQTPTSFLETILEAYQNPKTKTVEVPTPTAEQLQELQLKDNEIGRLKSAYSVIESNNTELQAEILRLTNRNAELESQPVPAPAPTLELADDQIIVTIPPIMSLVLDVEQEIAEKKTRKPWTVGDLLLNNFWESIKNGVSYPFRIWSSTELANLAKQIKEIEAEPQQ